MPKATVAANSQQRFDLSSCPDGFVVLRRMSFGEFLKRRELAAQMSTTGSTSKNLQTLIEVMQRKTAEFEFSHCVVEHNLEGDDGSLLDFKKPQTLDVLDPRIGQEIGKLIDEMNQFGEELGEGNL